MEASYVKISGKADEIGSIRVFFSHDININNVRLKNLQLNSYILLLDSIVIKEGNVAINASVSLTMSYVEAYETPNILVQALRTNIKDCFFIYQRKKNRDSQLVFNFEQSNIIIKRSVFICKDNSFGPGDHIRIYEESNLDLSSNDNCFNQPVEKSLIYASSVSIIGVGSNFNCYLYTYPPEIFNSNLKTSDLIVESFNSNNYSKETISGIIMIVVSIVLLICLLVIYCITSKKKIPSSDEGDDLVIPEDITLNNPLMVSMNTTLCPQTIIDISDNDFFTKAFYE